MWGTFQSGAASAEKCWKVLKRKEQVKSEWQEEAWWMKATNKEDEEKEKEKEKREENALKAMVSNPNSINQHSCCSASDNFITII